MVVTSFLAAENVIVDAATGQLNILNSLQSIPSSTFPFTLPRMTIVAILEKSEVETEDNVTVGFAMQFGEEKWGGRDFEISFVNKRQAFFRLTITAATVEKPDELRFTLTYKGQEIGKLSIPIEMTSRVSTEPEMNPTLHVTA